MLDKIAVRLNEAIAKDPEKWTYAMNEMTEEQNAALVALLEVMTKPLELIGGVTLSSPSPEFIAAKSNATQ